MLRIGVKKRMGKEAEGMKSEGGTIKGQTHTH